MTSHKSYTAYFKLATLEKAARKTGNPTVARAHRLDKSVFVIRVLMKTFKNNSCKKEIVQGHAVAWPNLEKWHR